jgi:hypothetical protein
MDKQHDVFYNDNFVCGMADETLFIFEHNLGQLLPQKGYFEMNS